MTRKLLNDGLIELSVADDDGRIWATITEDGKAALYDASAPKKKGRPFQKTVRVGDLPDGLEKLEVMLERNRRKE